MKQLLTDTGYIGVSNFIASLAQIGLQVYVVRSTSLFEFGGFAAALSVSSLLEAIFLSRSGELALQSVGKYWIEGNYVAARQCALKIKRLDLVINWSIYIFIVILALAFSNITGLNPLYLLGLSLMIPAQIGYGVYKSLFISSSLTSIRLFYCPL